MLSVEKISKSYSTGGWRGSGRQPVLKEMSLECRSGECVGIIGASGSGKSTLGRIILGLERPDAGSIRIDGEELGRRSRRGAVSAVFQDCRSSIHPFFTVRQALLEALGTRSSGKSKAERTRKLETALEQVGLEASYLERYPHELSGGQAQRVCLARALLTEARWIVLDEAVSSLDAPVQVQVLEVLRKARGIYGTGYLFITHDLEAAAFLCDRIAVLHEGRIIETIETQRLGELRTPCARELLDKFRIGHAPVPRQHAAMAEEEQE
ncbi:MULTISPECIES: ABC transporter ATP-binding protein [unclassified Paenibacillus]|uniref:ABC transporter ATP-binding protein n=1 Tax=unclassified Paenibacillus TaxID=185978 RepID=UPI00095662EA|nr:MULTISPECIES: ABC transporter ATP-binding protein [unclassified Paenibacillus]ASS65373.1 ABC transporter ATP-binding protein [Paenibacillus sp. RUD330]SIQ38372.1 nickel transport system ATP-binding protein [Paenibacillus sp. RU4X]SIQ60559.1 nickel transport system ATP-binding protein [Paenibacillus sp. RU4T]